MNMHKDLDQKHIAVEQNPFSPQRPTHEVEQIVVMVRLELYNRSLPCGARALRQHLDEHYQLKPLPSERQIGRILDRNALTHGRTGWYEGDHPESNCQ